MDPVSRDLAAWMPRLIAAWRRSQKISGPPDRLTAPEITQVARGIRRLSEGLTRARRLVGARYLDDRELLGAYLLYFWPVSYAQGRHALAELGTKPRAVLDLASGPGPLAFAALDAGAKDVWAADRSEPALDLARRLAADAGLPLQTRTWNPLEDQRLPGGDVGWNLVSMGHGLNELWADAPDRLARRVALCRSLLGALRKGGSLLVLEPALRTATRELLEVRDALVAAGHAVRAPCLFRGPCPALQREVDWCHAERAWEPPAVLQGLITAAGLHKEALKTAWVAHAPAGEPWAEPPPGRLFRIVSEHIEGHSRDRAMGCGPEGRVPLALADRQKSESNQLFLEAERGDVLALDGAEPSAEGPGLRLVASTRVTRVARAGEPLGPARGSR